MRTHYKAYTTVLVQVGACHEGACCVVEHCYHVHLNVLQLHSLSRSPHHYHFTLTNSANSLQGQLITCSGKYTLQRESSPSHITLP